MKRTAEAKMPQLLDAIPMPLPFRSDLHLARKTWHMMMGLVIVFCYSSGMSRSVGMVILSSVLGFDLLMEMTRLRSPTFNEKMLKFWGPVIRAHEVNQLSTIPHYVCAALIAVAIFPRPVAVLSILYLACGDPIASLMGILYGHRGPRFASGKTLIGTSAGTLVCSLVTFVYLKTLGYSDGTLVGMSIIGGLAGGMAELLPFEIDDNFTIPVISGFVLWLAFMIFGI